MVKFGKISQIYNREITSLHFCYSPIDNCNDNSSEEGITSLHRLLHYNLQDFVTNLQFYCNFWGLLY